MAGNPVCISVENIGSGNLGINNNNPSQRYVSGNKVNAYDATGGGGGYNTSWTNIGNIDAGKSFLVLMTGLYLAGKRFRS